MRLARPHPGEVATERVDLAVVAYVAVRVRQWPGWEGVGREARVNESERGCEIGLGKIAIEVAQLRRPQHPFVDDGSRRQARDVRRGRLEGDRRCLIRQALDSPPNDVE